MPTETPTTTTEPTPAPSAAGDHCFHDDGLPILRGPNAYEGVSVCCRCGLRRGWSQSFRPVPGHGAHYTPRALVREWERAGAGECPGEEGA